MEPNIDFDLDLLNLAIADQSNGDVGPGKIDAYKFSSEAARAATAN